MIAQLLYKGLIYPYYEYYSTVTEWGQYPGFRRARTLGYEVGVEKLRGLGSRRVKVFSLGFSVLKTYGLEFTAYS